MQEIYGLLCQPVVKDAIAHTMGAESFDAVLDSLAASLLDGPASLFRFVMSPNVPSPVIQPLTTNAPSVL